MCYCVFMNNILKISQKLLELSDSQGGVFSLADLKNLIASRSKAALYRILSELEASDILKQFCRGFYVTKNFNIQVLSQRICSDSYISFGSVLAKHLIIGSVPTYRIMAVKLGTTKKYSNAEYIIEQFQITEKLFMGFENIDGINIATPEKAFLDTLYFYQRGMKFSFDIYSDIDYGALNRKRIDEYLEVFTNKKYISFVNGVLNG